MWSFSYLAIGSNKRGALGWFSLQEVLIGLRASTNTSTLVIFVCVLIFVLFANLFLAFPLQQTYSNEVHCVEEILKVRWLIIIPHLKTHLSRQTYIHFLWLEWTVDILNVFKQLTSSLSYLPKQINQNNNKGRLRKPSDSLTDFNWNELYKLQDIWTRVFGPLPQAFLIKKTQGNQSPTLLPLTPLTPQRGDSLCCCNGRHPGLRSAWFSPLGVL